MSTVNVLVLSNIEWSDSNSFGNTVSNLFTSVPDFNFASLYTRNSLPRNNVCKLYYKISNTDIIKNFFCKEKIGDCFELLNNNTYLPETNNSEKKAIGLIHKYKLNRLFYFVEDTLFATQIWDNNKFKNFLRMFRPDIIFSFTKASKTQLLFIDSVKKYVPNCKHVTFIVDDIYSVFNSIEYKRIIGEQLSQASKIYAITPSLKKEYEDVFGVHIDILTKGCDFSLPVTKKENSVKSIVYAGNLLYGRDKTLIELGRIIKKHNEISDNKLVLKIYSPTLISDETKAAMNVLGASEFLGAKPYKEIVEIMNKADVVLHVESFDDEQQKIVKHSFSTKITDCMQSGSVLFSIGPDGLASIEATKNIDGAFCAVNLDEISCAIKKIADADLFENAKRIRAYALEHFAIEKIQQKIVDDFKAII